MPTVRNKPITDCADLEAKIRHYQDINDQIEQKTYAVFESVSKLNNHSSKHENVAKLEISVFKEQEKKNNIKSHERSETPVRSEARGKSAAIKNQIIVDLNQRLREVQSELDDAVLQKKKLEDHQEQQKQELINLRESMKKMKSTLHSKQLLHDAQKKEINVLSDKLKMEEQSRKSLQKEAEKLAKHLAATMADKEKLIEKCEHTKTDLLLIKQHKTDGYPNNKVPIMLKCIRKQALLIENLLKQVSCLEQVNK